MAPKRILPSRGNPLIEPDRTPRLSTLLERRRIGQTNLTVRPGFAGIANATKEQNLGLFDYAHLRLPLPTDLQDSGIFMPQHNGKYPDSYFLMRRSNDGYVSATGMFKAAYPWSQPEEVEAERQHHLKLPGVAGDEVAGNIWISPEASLKLAVEYGMKPWIEALLDPEPIEKGNREKDGLLISTPPKFVLPEKGSILPPPSTAKGRRTRRSVSPTKNATPSRKIASPRKPRARKNKADDAVKPLESPLAAASTDLQDIIANGATPIKEFKAGGSGIEASKDTVRIEVDETVEKIGNKETHTTNVKVDVPASHPELTIPENTEDLIANAKAMVEEANKLDKSRSNSGKSKRKADELKSDLEDGSTDLQPVKKAKILEENLRKEKVKTRALWGLGATVAVGMVIPYFL